MFFTKKFGGRVLSPLSIVIFPIAIFWLGGGIPGGTHTGTPDTSTAPSQSHISTATSTQPASSANTQSAHRSNDVIDDAVVAPGSTVFSTLAAAGMKSSSIAAVLDVAKPLQDLARVAAGTIIRITWAAERRVEPARLEFKVDQERSLVLENRADKPAASASETPDIQPAVASEWNAHFKAAHLTTKTVAFTGVVTSNLWNSASSAGMDPLLINQLTEIFAWQVDFNRAVQLNDRWRLTVEQQFADDAPIGWGNILAAEYENNGIKFSAVRFAHDGFKNQYFDADGNSLQRMFLKSPLKFARITSGFSAQRFHPILKRRRAHLGVDYGAPTGTPVMSVGNGVVNFVGARGGSGKMIQIRHNSTYETNYKHLSRYAAGLKVGDRVEMGQVIGYVGATGLATGPHLHFEFYESHRFVDPQGLRFPAADPVPAAFAAEFKSTSTAILATLPPWSKALLTEENRKAHRHSSASN